MLIVAELFNIAVNYFDTKKSALCSRVLVVTELAGFPLGLENEKAFSSQGKVGEFWTDWKSQGKSHKILEFETNII